VAYGVVLIMVVAFAPRGVDGAVARCRAWLLPRAKPAKAAPHD